MLSEECTAFETVLHLHATDLRTAPYHAQVPRKSDPVHTITFYHEKPWSSLNYRICERKSYLSYMWPLHNTCALYIIS